MADFGETRGNQCEHTNTLLHIIGKNTLPGGGQRVFKSMG